MSFELPLSFPRTFSLDHARPATNQHRRIGFPGTSAHERERIQTLFCFVARSTKGITLSESRLPSAAPIFYFFSPRGSCIYIYSACIAADVCASSRGDGHSRIDLYTKSLFYFIRIRICIHILGYILWSSSYSSFMKYAKG